MQEYLSIDSEDILLIVAGKIDKQSQRAKWYTALDQSGTVVTVWPIQPRDLPSWIQKRLNQRGMKYDREAITMLAERVEGNLLAAAQEVEKLSLLANNTHVTTEIVSQSVGNSARYNAFNMVDTALAGDARGALRALRGLKAEGSAAPAILWPISKELRLLIDASSAVKKGTSPGAALDRLGVWRSRLNLMQQALGRHTESLDHCLHLNFAADGSAKGFMPETAGTISSHLLWRLPQARNLRQPVGARKAPAPLTPPALTLQQGRNEPCPLCKCAIGSSPQCRRCHHCHRP